MTPHVARETGPQLDEAVETLLPRERDLDYGNFRPVAERPGAAVALHRSRFAEAADRGGALVARTPDGRPLAALHFHERPFESAHFGEAMARIEPPLGPREGDERTAAAGARCACRPLGRTPVVKGKAGSRRDRRPSRAGVSGPRRSRRLHPDSG